jgi:hypothetical protein
MLIPGLIAVWAIAIAWYALSGRESSASRSFSLVRGFGSPAVGLESPLGLPYGSMSASMRALRIAERRRNVILSLASATFLTVMLAIAVGGLLLWLAFVVFAASLGGYLYALAQIRANAAARRPIPENVYQLDEHRRDAGFYADRIAL